MNNETSKLTSDEQQALRLWFDDAIAASQSGCPFVAAERAQERADETLDWPSDEAEWEAKEDAVVAFLDALASLDALADRETTKQIWTVVYISDAKQHSELNTACWIGTHSSEQSAKDAVVDFVDSWSEDAVIWNRHIEHDNGGGMTTGAVSNGDVVYLTRHI